MCNKQGNSYYVHYNIKEVSDQWAVGLMGCRTNGLSDHREVTIMTAIKLLKSSNQLKTVISLPYESEGDF